jgi:hypothetical protein
VNPAPIERIHNGRREKRKDRKTAKDSEKRERPKAKS